MMIMMKFAVLMIIILALLTPTTFSITPPVAKQGCVDHCGNISIPYPFGTSENCYHYRNFWLTCNNTVLEGPKLFLGTSGIEITNISLDGQLKVLQSIASNCYDSNGAELSTKSPWIRFATFRVSNTANKFTTLGCDTYGYISGSRRGQRKFTTGCMATCGSTSDLSAGSCTGMGCCQTEIPQDMSNIQVEVHSWDNYTYVNGSNCGYAFLVDKSAFSFSPENLTSLTNVTRLPMVVDWSIGNVTTCKEAQMNSSSYACLSVHSECYKPGNGNGYRCRCKDGYRGSPYIADGCQDINECNDPEVPHNCTHHCENIPGSFNCTCPKGYHGDGEGCSRDASLLIKLVAGISVGVTGLLLALGCLYFEIKRRSSNKNKQRFFLQNGGNLLQEKLMGKDRSQDNTNNVNIFSSSELHKATNDFHSSMIIGQGGFGVVYKGILPNNSVIAIKKSKKIDPNQIEQFINEVVVLSQINHRNVVKLLGCCLETEVPLLVYEFVDNGTLATNIHDQAKAHFLDWGMRLRIAAETAGVLSYLHSAASVPIIHRDVKSDNILLDHTYTAKVSDFGASRLVPLDQTELSTMVQGTFGYLDPEYMQTNQLTEKSDVYSFGVVLLEILTGRKAISFDKPESEKNLANYFLSILKQERLLEVLDDNLVGYEENMDQITEVAKLAQGCLHVKGQDRPSMKEVAMELEGLRLGGKHSWVKTGQNEEEMESLLGKGFNNMESLLGDGFHSFAGNSSTSVGYDSIRDHVILPISGGR